MTDQHTRDTLQPIRLNEQQLREQVTCWDEFVNQVVAHACDTYGVEHNNWALYMPALMATLTGDVSRRINQMEHVSDQLMINLDDTPEETEEPEDAETLLSIGTRMKQLQTGTQIKLERDPEPKIMDPFRRIKHEQSKRQAIKAQNKSDQEPDVWEADEDWNE